MAKVMGSEQTPNLILADIAATISRLGNYTRLEMVKPQISDDPSNQKISFLAGALSSLEGLTSDNFREFLNDDQRKSFLEEFKKGKDDYLNLVKTEPEKQFFNDKIIQIEGLINGFGGAKIPDKTPPDEKKAIQDVIKQAMNNISDKNYPKAEYIKRLQEETINVLKTDQKYSAYAKDAYKIGGYVEAGEIKPRSLGLSGDQLESISNAVFKASHDFLKYYKDPESITPVINDLIKDRIGDTNDLTPTDRITLKKDLESIKELWETKTENHINMAKVTYINNPIRPVEIIDEQFVKITDPKKVFVKIAKELLEKSTPEQIKTLSPATLKAIPSEIFSSNILNDTYKKLEEKGFKVDDTMKEKISKALMPTLSDLDNGYLASNTEKITDALTKELISDKSLSTTFTKNFTISTSSLEKIAHKTSQEYLVANRPEEFKEKGVGKERFTKFIDDVKKGGAKVPKELEKLLKDKYISVKNVEKIRSLNPKLFDETVLAKNAANSKAEIMVKQTQNVNAQAAMQEAHVATRMKNSEVDPTVSYNKTKKIAPHSARAAKPPYPPMPPESVKELKNIEKTVEKTQSNAKKSKKTQNNWVDKTIKPLARHSKGGPSMT